MTSLQIRLDPVTHARLKRIAERRGVLTVAGLARMFIMEGLERADFGEPKKGKREA